MYSVTTFDDRSRDTCWSHDVIENAWIVYQNAHLSPSVVVYISSKMIMYCTCRPRAQLIWNL